LIPRLKVFPGLSFSNSLEQTHAGSLGRIVIGVDFESINNRDLLLFEGRVSTIV
jgi:hypothetical protein